jgi:hypothetical protein
MGGGGGGGGGGAESEGFDMWSGNTSPANSRNRQLIHL